MGSFWQIFYNIIGGILVAVFILVWSWVYKKLYKKYYGYSFKRIFGRDSKDNFNVVYGSMKLAAVFNEKGKLIKFPYYKDGVRGSFGNISSVVSLTGAKSTEYISEAFARIFGTSPKIISDIDIKKKLDISFCSIGGRNNLKTGDVMDSDQNNFFEFDLSENSANIFLKEDSQKRFYIDGKYDHGFIIKIIPKSFPKRVWISVAGLGEWGTSGAVWFLMRNWKKLPKDKSFGLVIKTKGGQDESAELVYKKVEKK